MCNTASTRTPWWAPSSAPSTYTDLKLFYNPPPLLTTDIALRLYHMDHGAYPAQLDGLVAGGYLKNVPQDTFNPGYSLRYRRDGSRYVLCSWAPDEAEDTNATAGRFAIPSPQCRLWRGKSVGRVALLLWYGALD